MDAVEAAVVERAFVRVGGPEAEHYLQGQLSQDVGPGGGLSFLLDPSGKVVAFLRFVRIGGDFQLDTDPEAGDAVVARLRRFLLRTKADIEPVAGQSLVRVFGAAPLPQAQIVTAWPPQDGTVQDVFVPAAEAGAEVARLEATPLADEEHERRRILAGVPRSGVDIGAETIPAEAGRWTIESGVSFTKGCYTGQELVARIDSRGGNVPRPLRVIRFDRPVPAGSEIAVDDGPTAGTVTSAAGDVAMGPVLRRVEVGATVRAAGETGTIVR